MTEDSRYESGICLYPVESLEYMLRESGWYRDLYLQVVPGEGCLQAFAGGDFFIASAHPGRLQKAQEAAGMRAQT